MSSVNEVIVSSWAIFGSLTNVPLPCRRTRSPSRTRSSSAARTVRRDTPSSPTSWRSDGIASPTPSCSIRSSTLAPRLALLRHGPLHVTRLARGVLPRGTSRCSWSRPLLGGPTAAARRTAARRLRRASAEPSSASKKWNRAGSTASSSVSPWRASDARVDAGREERRLVREQRRVLVSRRRGRPAAAVRVDPETRRACRRRAPRARPPCTSSRGRPLGGEARRPRTPPGRMPSTTRPPLPGPSCPASSGIAWPPKRTLVPVDRRLDEVHRRRADERGDEDVPRPRRRASAARRPARSVPSRMTATRWPSVIASVWSWVTYTVVTPRRACSSGERGAHADAELRVEVRERLVHQERPRLADDRASHRDALPLAAGELRRLAVEQLGRARAAPPPPRRAARASAFGARAHLEPVAEVLAHGHVRVERVALEDHRDVAPPRRELGDVLAVDPDRPVRHLLEARDHPQQRRLAAAGRARRGR